MAGLARRAPLTRRTPLTGGGQLRRTGIARVSPKRKAQAALRERVWLAVLSRDRNCLLAGGPGPAGECRGRLTPHHLHKAGQGGPFTQANIVCLCAGHNTWVEDHPPVAHALGLVVRQGETVALAWQRLRARGLVESGPT